MQLLTCVVRACTMPWYLCALHATAAGGFSLTVNAMLDVFRRAAAEEEWEAYGAVE